MVGGGGYVDVLHVSLNLWQNVRGGGGCGVSRCTVDGAGSVRAAEGVATFLVHLIGATCCGVRGEEGFPPCHRHSLGLPELVPSLTFG